MEVHTHTPVIAKRLWNVLRITFFMIRKGLISKRKLMMDMNLMMKRGKLLRKSLINLMSHHHHSNPRVTGGRGGFGLQEYEFSCTNSPNPVFFHVHERKHHNYFPCINPPKVIEEDQQVEEDHYDDPSNFILQEQEPKAVLLVPKTPEYTFNFNFPINGDASDFGPGEKLSPLLSPFSVRVSNFSSEDENDIGRSRQVDHEAEEFIKRFYEQLRAQNRIQLLQYQESAIPEEDS